MGGSQVQERVAFELDVQPYRATVSTGTGVVLTGEKTLAKYGISEDAQLFVVIGELDKWREMSQDEFIEHVVARRLDTRENLMRSLRSQLTAKSAEFDEMIFRKRFISQLTAIEEAEERRQRVQEEAEERKRQREKRRQHVQDTVATEANAMVSELGMEAAVNALQARIMAVSTSCSEKVAQAAAIRDDCQRDLDEALPALMASVRALECLDKRDITEVKCLAKPPELVCVVGDAICILFEEKPCWGSTKKLLNDCHLLGRMLSFDKDNICPKSIKQLDKYIQRADFTPEAVGRASRAMASMCQWVHAMYTYDRVAKAVEPKKLKLMEADDVLQDTTWELDNLQKRLADVQERLRAADCSANA